MRAKQPQVVEPQEFTYVCEDEFSGDDATVSRKRDFITAYHEHGTVYHAAIVAGIHRATVWKWIEKDPLFAQAYKDSHEDCADDIETSVFKRAKTDSLLAMFYLKAKRPAFRDKLAIDVPTIQNQVKEFMQQLLSSHATNVDNHHDAIRTDASQNKREQLLLSPATTNGDDSPS
jgi:hypothetical protein